MKGQRLCLGRKQLVCCTLQAVVCVTLIALMISRSYKDLDLQPETGEEGPVAVVFTIPPEEAPVEQPQRPANAVFLLHMPSLASSSLQNILLRKALKTKANIATPRHNKPEFCFPQPFDV